MAAGNVSLELCDRFTWSFGWIGVRRVTKRFTASRLASVATTSFMFMLLCVPDPVCHTLRGNWLSQSPAATDTHASEMSEHIWASSTPSSSLARAAACLSWAKARMMPTGCVSVPMGKFSSERCVCAPHKASAGTRISPIESCSMR